MSTVWTRACLTQFTGDSPQQQAGVRNWFFLIWPSALSDAISLWSSAWCFLHLQYPPCGLGTSMKLLAAASAMKVENMVPSLPRKAAKVLLEVEVEDLWNRVRCSRSCLGVSGLFSILPRHLIHLVNWHLSYSLYLSVIISHQVCGHIYCTKSLRFLPHQRRGGPCPDSRLR